MVAETPADESELGRPIPAIAAPQSEQNLALAGVSAPHFEQGIGSVLPHSAQNRLPGKLSVPHFEQRIFPQLSDYPLSSSISALASFRSAVSKPSVNQL